MTPSIVDRRVRGEAARHERAVHVAVHGDDRRYRLEALDDVEGADVAGVEDAFDAAEDVGESRVEVAVGVGDEADEHGSFRGRDRVASRAMAAAPSAGARSPSSPTTMRTSLQLCANDSRCAVSRAGPR